MVNYFELPISFLNATMHENKPSFNCYAWADLNQMGHWAKNYSARKCPEIF